MTVFRSLAGAVFPLFATYMYEGLGPRWASSLLGFIALLMMPIPIVLSRCVYLFSLSIVLVTYFTPQDGPQTTS